MKVAILGDTAPGYISPMMHGLERMLKKLRCEPVVPPYGIKMLSNSSGVKGFIKNGAFKAYMTQLVNCDAIIVVQHLRDAFHPSLKIKELRRIFPDKPIVLYDLVYLPTVGLWGPWLEPPESRSICGMDRYDWYLCVSVQNRLPMPLGEQPCSEIGIDLNDGTLFPEQYGTFKALIDFEREAYPGERQIQLEALRETETDYTVLRGQYSIADIRAVYRTSSIYFLAHMESFGVPICELQASGSLIFTPYAGWCDAHRLHDHTLSPNFVIYNNDKERLIQAIQHHKEQASPQAVVDQFLKYHGHFMQGNLNQLQDFIDQLSRGEITSQSHLQYKDRTEAIPPRGDDTNSDRATPAHSSAEQTTTPANAREPNRSID
jgi:hypothetical protein